MTATVDPSRRYVLEADSPYLGNMAALWAADPALAREIEATEGERSYTVERSRAGLPTLRVPGPGGRDIYLHSRYEPAEEAGKLIAAVETDACVAFYVQGFGLGYHVEQLFDAASDEAIFCVLEPDLLLLRTALETRDLSRLIESRRVLFFWREDKAELFTRLSPQTGLLSMGFQAVTHPPSVQRHPQFYRQMGTWLGEFAAWCRTALNTLILNGRRTAENVARNIGLYAIAPGIERLKDRYKGRPAIIVSAGPSLRKNKHLLKEAQGKAVIVAVQTTLQPLVEMGVVPQFVTSLDWSDISTRFFEKLPPALPTELVAEPKASSKVLELHPGPLSILGNDFGDGLLREMRLGKARLNAGATVAHLAFYLAEHLGCDPIIFIGQDLGFSDGLCYTPGTSYEDVWRPELSRFCTLEMKQWEQIVRDKHILRRIPDHAGRPMYTEERLYTYLQQFERDFARTAARVIDATEGGAAKRGAASMTLADAIAQYCTQPLPEAAADYPGLQTRFLTEAAECLRRRIDEAASIEAIASETLPLLEQVRDCIGDAGRVNSLIAHIDPLRARMTRLNATYELIQQLAQLTELKRFQRDRLLVAKRIEGDQLQRRQVERDIDNVAGILEGAKNFQSLLREVLQALQAKEGAWRA